jgi:hypothetical protein
MMQHIEFSPSSSRSAGECSSRDEDACRAFVDLLALALRIPDCKEFRNDCQVCINLPERKHGCSDIGVAQSERKLALRGAQPRTQVMLLPGCKHSSSAHWPADAAAW